MSFVSWTPAFEDTPSGADPGSIIDNKFNEFKEQTRRLMMQAGINMPSILESEDGATPHDDGATGPIGIPGVLMVDAGGSGIGGQIWNSGGTAKVMDPTDAGVAFPIIATGGNITTGANPGHQHDVTFAIALPFLNAGLVLGVIFENRGNGDITLLEARLVAGIAPVGGDLFLQMRLLPTSWTDPSDVGTDVWLNVNRPTVDDGLFKGTPTSTIADATLEVGEAWTFEIDSDGGSPNGGNDVTVILHVQRN